MIDLQDSFQCKEKEKKVTFSLLLSKEAAQSGGCDLFWKEVLSLDIIESV